jgi:uncharacterized protein (DUF924 family)
MSEAMDAPTHQEAASVLEFWFEEIDPARWWSKDSAFDTLIGERFGALLARAGRCELYRWRESAPGRLAEIIVLDQFSRNVHRDTAGAFANDPLALALAQEAISAGADRALEAQRRSFLYMPFMHSESLEIHDVAMELFEANGDQSTLEFELRHRAIIERFGRYPHRNAVLGRRSSVAELDFLTEPGSSF